MLCRVYTEDPPFVNTANDVTYLRQTGTQLRAVVV